MKTSFDHDRRGEGALETASAITPPPLQAVAPDVTAPLAAGAPAALELLGDEIIQLSLKPSLWYIPLVSARWLGCAGVLALGMLVAAQTGWTVATSLGFNLALSLAGLRLGLGTLQWASRLYVLTNRRVIRFKGVFSVASAECPLRDIANVVLVRPGLQRFLPLGNVVMLDRRDGGRTLSWSALARPEEVHELVRRAVARSRE
jgi:hypothetical protein